MFKPFTTACFHFVHLSLSQVGYRGFHHDPSPPRWVGKTRLAPSLQWKKWQSWATQKTQKAWIMFSIMEIYEILCQIMKILWKYYEKCERTPLQKRLKKVTINYKTYKAASDIWTSADLLAIADRSEKLSDLASKSHPWRDEDRWDVDSPALMCLETTNTYKIYKIYKHTKKEKEHHLERVQNEFRIWIPGQTAPLSWNVCSVFMSFAIFMILQASGVVARKLNNWCTGALSKAEIQHEYPWIIFCFQKMSAQKPSKMCRMCHNFEGQAVMVHTACAQHVRGLEPNGGRPTRRVVLRASPRRPMPRTVPHKSHPEKRGKNKAKTTHQKSLKIWNAETRNRMESILLKFCAFSWSRFCKAHQSPKHHKAPPFPGCLAFFPCKGCNCVGCSSSQTKAWNRFRSEKNVWRVCRPIDKLGEVMRFRLVKGKIQKDEGNKQNWLESWDAMPDQGMQASMKTSGPDSLTTVRSSSH